jgi:O-antigen ligase
MPILFGLIVAIVSLVLTYRKPAWGLGGVLALLPSYLIRGEFFSIPTTALEMMIAGFLVGIILTKPNWSKIKELGRLHWAIGLFLLAAIISVFASPERAAALGQLKAFFVEPLLIFYCAILILQDIDSRRTVLKILFAAAGLLSLFGLLQYFTYIYLPIRFWGSGIEPERITSLFEYPNALALYLGPLLALFGTLLLKGYKLFEEKWLNWIIFASMAVALTLTFSRGAWLAVTITLVLMLLKNRAGKKAAGIILLLIFIGFVVPPIRQRLMTGTQDASTSAHAELLKAGIDKVSQSPYLGNGLYGFRTTLAENNFQGEILNYPHNIFLNFWLELGLLGLIGFCFIIFLAFEKSRHNHSPEAQAAIAFILVVLLHGLVDVPYFKNDLSILFWFAISLLYI